MFLNKLVLKKLSTVSVLLLKRAFVFVKNMEIPGLSYKACGIYTYDYQYFAELTKKV